MRRMPIYSIMSVVLVLFILFLVGCSVLSSIAVF